MGALEADLELIEEAMSRFFQAMKRPQAWTRITERAGVQIDRPAAGILHALMLYHGNQGCHLNDLAAQLSIEAPSVTRKTQELEQAGLIRRRRDPQDGRAVDLQLTARGRQVSRKLWDARRAGVHEILASWPASDRQRFVKLFDRFSQDINMYYQTERRNHVSQR
ncbi:MAG TPA: MarR family transcriptional regulator [Candidatus Saccharimonadales bacterium]|nr:MarR family transcriptional regulator [Candidatus Saccharimonadales bacterium]